MQEILSRHGQLVVLRLADGDASTRAFLQPIVTRNEHVPETVTELGSLDDRLWLYLGKSAVQPGDRILWNDTEFCVRSSRPYYIGDQLIYWWASLEQAKEAAE